MPKLNKESYKIAYFCMEIALENSIKTYAGGLGVLSGDTLHSAADLEFPMVGVTLLNDQGYFKQKINKEGKQVELPAHYKFHKLKKLDNQITIKINKDIVKVGVWEYIIKGITDFPVPIYLLDTKINGNTPLYSSLTGQLYRARKPYRLMQEIVLGRAGVKMLKELNYNIKKYHLNEGHAALAAVELFNQTKGKTNKDKRKKTQNKCIFTTHTPVKAGHDIFNKTLMKSYQRDFPFELKGLIKNSSINMTKIALYFSGYINGVARQHKEISLKMYPKYRIDAITNGIHSATWTAPAFKKLYDKYIPTWRSSSFSFRNVFRIPKKKIWDAHQTAKKNLLKEIYKRQKIKLSPYVFTIGFARRFTTYKRPDLLFYDIDRLKHIHKNIGELQIVFAGKAHPSDKEGKKLIEKIISIKKRTKDSLKLIFLEGYDLNLAKLMISGVDLWLNTPLPPFEASGTSGMKAAHNGIPHLSTLDGWWVEGHIENKTGWAIGQKNWKGTIKTRNKNDSNDLYEKLETIILSMYYKDREAWEKVMRNTIAINASFFNSHRMLQQYIQEAYYIR
jgi:starch phosphorylase